MNILMVSPYPVYPPVFGGQARIFGLAKAYAKLGHSVTILANVSYLFGPQKNLDVDGVHLRFCRTYFQDLASFLFVHSLAPLIISYPFNTLAGFFLRHWFLGQDVIIFEQPYLAGWMRYCKGVPIVYSSQNVEVDFETLQLSTKFGKKYFEYLLSTCEKNAMEKSALVLACAHADKQRLSQLYSKPATKIEVIENGFESFPVTKNRRELRAKLGLPQDKKVAVFIGSHSMPNVRAVSFIRNHLYTKCPEYVFVLIGESSTMSASPDPERIISVGEVNDVSRWMMAADVGILPLDQGSGSSLKLLEYLRHGLPVVSTAIGARGFESIKTNIHPVSLSYFHTRLNKKEYDRVPKSSLEQYLWDNLAARVIALISK